MGNSKEELKMVYTCVLSKEKQKIVRVSFERAGAYAEGIVPEGKIEKQKGFTKEEIEQLEIYLKLNKDNILKNAKEISGISHWF